MRPWLDAHLMLQHTKTYVVIKMTMRPLLNLQLMLQHTNTCIEMKMKMRPLLNMQLMLQYKKTCVVIKNDNDVIAQHASDATAHQNMCHNQMTTRPLLDVQLMQNSIMCNIRLKKQRFEINVDSWMHSTID
jgi:hypothetical protein